MRIIPKKTKVSTEFFRGVTGPDIIVGFFGVLVMFFVFMSSLPGKLLIELGLFVIFGLLLIRIDDEPNYMFLIKMIRHFSYRRGYRKIPTRKDSGEDEAGPGAGTEDKKTRRRRLKKEKKEKKRTQETAGGPELSKKEARELKKQKKKERRAEDKLLKNKKVPESEKAPIRARRKKEAYEQYRKMKLAEHERKRVDITKLYLVTEIRDGFINYSNEYLGAAIEIPPVEFRFFSPARQNNSIERALGSVIRTVGARYSANIVKVEQPMMMDDYIKNEYRKIGQMRSAYERGVLTEEELKARVEVVYDRINDLMAKNSRDKVLLPHYYLVLFDADRRQLNNAVNSAIGMLAQGEMRPHRLNDRELAAFLKYTNSADFDERELDHMDKSDYALYAMPESVQINSRTVEVNSIVTHNLRVINYPLTVGNAWGAALFDIPGTKVVMKFSQMDRNKSIRAIDRSIGELQSQLAKTDVSSRVIELQTHIETLSELLVMLQNNNENLMLANMYITGYDILATREDRKIVPQPAPSVLPRVSNMKKDIKRIYSERGFKLNDCSFEQMEAFVAGQVNAYDPFQKRGRGMPSNSLAAVMPWVYASLADRNGLNIGSSGGIPTFIDFFRRDSERVNSNMVVVGKSGGGKSYAAKSILTNLAADDSKIFVLDPENEYAELASNLKGKFINVANASHGRINPFQIITSLEDDEAEDGEETSSFAAHLQFLEEFFRQILPDIDGDALEYLNTLINRVYMRKNIDQYTNLNSLKPEDYPIFDDLYDCVLEEFQRSKSDYLRSNLRVLMNYIAKFSTGGRNANIWNGPSTLSTAENFIVFNFQALLANRNNTIANAQMLLVMKYLDNEIIKNREYNLKYGADRKIVVVIDEAHVFIDSKYPLALDFMFQLAKRIRKYNGMQIVITQNIKDFVGSEELARKSTAIINACQYSLIFSLAPNDMQDLCKLYEKAGGINESEQEQIIAAGRGQAFVVTGPTSRASMQIVVPPSVAEMFDSPEYETHYFAGEQGARNWEELVGGSRDVRAKFLAEKNKKEEKPEKESTPDVHFETVNFVEEEPAEETEQSAREEENAPDGSTRPKWMNTLEEEEKGPGPDGPFTPTALQQYGFEALVSEIRRTVRQEVERELRAGGHAPSESGLSEEPAAEPGFTGTDSGDFWGGTAGTAGQTREESAFSYAGDSIWGDSAAWDDGSSTDTGDLFGGMDLFPEPPEQEISAGTEEPGTPAAAEETPVSAEGSAEEPQPETVSPEEPQPAEISPEETETEAEKRPEVEELSLEELFGPGPIHPKTAETEPLAGQETSVGQLPEEETSRPAEEEKPLVYEITLDELIAMEDEETEA